MSINFGDKERFILNSFSKGTKFNFKNTQYEVLMSDKPTCPNGEPKTDIYVLAKNLKTNNKKEFKISFKKENADFLENKISAERAKQILGNDWKNIIHKSIIKLEDKFKNRKLIFKKRDYPTKAGSITLGWRFEFVNKNSGELSGEIELSQKQLVDIYAGTNLSQNKQNSSVNGQIINKSGVANYIIEYTPKELDDLNKIISELIPIEEYIKENSKIYFVCKALNYRTFNDKYDGNRPLAVYIDWEITNNKLNPNFIFDEPLIKGGHYVADKLNTTLQKLDIETTEDINNSNVISSEFIYKPQE